MSILAQYLVGGAALSALMSLVWLAQRRSGNAGTVDVAWTFGVGFLAALFALTSGGSITARVLVGGIGSLWSLRLGLFLYRRVVGQEEDGRYRRLRQEWGRNAQRNLFFFFQAQALLALLLGVSFQVVSWNPRPGPGPWALLGLLVAAISIAGESIADRQLRRFKADPANRGRTCRAGLWRYSRHPNYFFEWLHWCAYLPLAVGAPLAWATAVAPLVMLFLLLRVTGIPAAEEQALRSRGDDYRRYQRTTSAFFPWFPKAEVSECN